MTFLHAHWRRVVADVLCIALLGGLLWAGYTLWVRARNGEAAFEYLQNAVRQQQQAQQKPPK